MAFLFRWLMRARSRPGRPRRRRRRAGVLSRRTIASRLLTATLTLDGPEQEIEIVRDRYAVPHILSKTDHDAFFGLGLRACPGPALADDAAAAHGAGAALRALRARDAGDRRADAGARPLRAARGRGGRCRPTPPGRRSRPMPTGSTPGSGWCRTRRSAAARRSSSCSRRTSRPGRRRTRSRCRSCSRCS